MKVFLSSTYQDLDAHRSTVENSFSISDIDYNAMEHFGSTLSPPLQTCLDAVRDSDVFVGVLGVRYGSSPPGRILSFTEREYREARLLGMPILMFLIDMRNALVKPELIQNETAEQQARLVNFKSYVINHHTVTYFTSPEDLARLILASIIKEFGVI